MDEIKQSVFNFLLKESSDHGIVPVRAACELFLKVGLRPNENSEPRRFTKAQVKKAWLRQKGRCNRCHDPLALDEAAGDHIIPWSEGGRTEDSNCGAVHGVKSDRVCNSEKGARDLLADSKKTGNFFNETLPNEEYQEPGDGSCPASD